MNYLKLSAFLALSFYLSICSPLTLRVAPVVGADIPIQRDYEQQREDNTENRRHIFDLSRERYFGPSCENKARDHKCKEQCMNIYTRRQDRDDCKELKIGQIEDLEKLHRLLKWPNNDDLAELDLEDFKVYMNISTSSFDKLVNKYRKGDAKEMLLWIAENEDVAELLKDKDDEFKVLQKLLSKIKSDVNENENIYDYFTTNIDCDDTLMELVIDSSNESAHNWFLDYINEKHSGCEDNVTSKACFFVYCKIGEDIDIDIKEDWLGFEEFDEYIESIIDANVNGSLDNAQCWDTNEIGDIGDIDDWVDVLCKPNNVFIAADNGCKNGR